jgi:hypothetical protein
MEISQEAIDEVARVSGQNAKEKTRAVALAKLRAKLAAIPASSFSYVVYELMRWSEWAVELGLEGEAKRLKEMSEDLKEIGGINGN